MTAPLIYLHPTPTPVVAEPNSCALCGSEEHRHGRYTGRGHTSSDTDLYVAPDDATRAARMRARRDQAVR